MASLDESRFRRIREKTGSFSREVVALAAVAVKHPFGWEDTRRFRHTALQCRVQAYSGPGVSTLKLVYGGGLAIADLIDFEQGEAHLEEEIIDLPVEARFGQILVITKGFGTPGAEDCHSLLDTLPGERVESQL